MLGYASILSLLFLLTLTLALTLISNICNPRSKNITFFPIACFDFSPYIFSL